MVVQFHPSELNRITMVEDILKDGFINSAKSDPISITRSVALNKDLVGKYLILKDIGCSDYMKDQKGKIILFDTLEDACSTCWINEFEDAIVIKVGYNHIERG